MTPPSSTTAEIEALLASTGWVRDLARRLVGDPDLADDLAQQTYLAALEHRPSADRSLRGWLATVLRNFARQGARGTARRDARERHVAHEGTDPSTLELVERLSAQRQVSDAVAELDEPYRGTLLLRYFEGRSPSEIARRQGIPVSTVKTRLARGLTRLRARLERDGGGRASWLSALLPLIDTSGGSAAPAFGVLAVGTPLKLSLAAAGVVAAGLVVAWPKAVPAAAGPVVATSTEGASELAPPPTELAQAPAPGTGRVRVSVPAATTPVAEAAAAVPVATATPLRGRVLDVEGRPLAGVRVRFEPAPAADSARPPRSVRSTAVSLADGRFEFPEVEGSGWLLADDPGTTTLYRGVASSLRRHAEPVVVVAPRQPLAGVVVDEAGEPVEGAEVSVEPPAGFRSRFAEVMAHSTAVDLRSTTGERGRFELTNAPLLEGARLIASAEGYEPWAGPLPEFADASLVLTLVRPNPREGLLGGRVVDERGVGVPEASVAYGIESTVTDANGDFAFQMAAEDSPNRMAERFLGQKARRLIAMKAGYLPASLTVELSPDGEAGWPEGIVLRLVGQPLSVEGRVVDAHGGPLAGVRVWIADATLFALDRETGPRVLESMLAGAEQAWNWDETDEEGRFRLEGLAEREYRLGAMDPDTLLRAESEPVPAGAKGVELSLDTDALWKRIAGRCVDRRGQPMPGLHVFPMSDPFRLSYEGQVVSTTHGTTEGVVTDEDGAFELGDVPRELVYLRIDGEDVISTEYGRHVPGGLGELARGALEELEIVVPLRVHFQVEVADPSLADEVAVLDGDEHEIVINLIQADSRRENEHMPLIDGRSDVLTVTDDAATLVLLRDGQPVARHELQLERGRVNRIQL